MEDKNSKSRYQASSDDGKSAFKNFCDEHPVIMMICVLALPCICIFGGMIGGVFLYALFIIATVLFSIIAASIIYNLVSLLYHVIIRMHDGDKDDKMARQGAKKASKSKVRKAERDLEIPEALKKLVKDGSPEAISISNDYSKMMKAADDAGENRDKVAASYGVTLDNAAKIISTYRDMCSHPADFNDLDSVKKEYSDTMQSLHLSMLTEIRRLNEWKLSSMRDDMKTVKTTAEQNQHAE